MISAMIFSIAGQGLYFTIKAPPQLVNPSSRVMLAKVCPFLRKDALISSQCHPCSLFVFISLILLSFERLLLRLGKYTIAIKKLQCNEKNYFI